MVVNVILYKRGNEVITVVVTLKIEEKNITVINLLHIIYKYCSQKMYPWSNLYNKDHLNLKLVLY